jgi:hypothetical protein
MAEESNKITASDILKVLGSLALGGLAGGALGRASVLGGRSAVGGRPNVSDVLMKTTATYPNLTKSFNYGVVFDEANARAGVPSLNRMLAPIALTGAYPNAQTLEEHNRAVSEGTEPLLEAWWPGEDDEPRKPLTPSSTAVKNIRIGTDNKIYVTFANGKKEYSYVGGDNPLEAASAAAELIRSQSIGRSLLPARGFWGIKYHDPKYPVYVPGTKK